MRLVGLLNRKSNLRRCLNSTGSNWSVRQQSQSSFSSRRCYELSSPSCPGPKYGSINSSIRNVPPSKPPPVPGGKELSGTMEYRIGGTAKSDVAINEYWAHDRLACGWSVGCSSDRGASYGFVSLIAQFPASSLKSWIHTTNNRQCTKA